MKKREPTVTEYFNQSPCRKEVLCTWGRAKKGLSKKKYHRWLEQAFNQISFDLTRDGLRLLKAKIDMHRDQEVRKMNKEELLWQLEVWLLGCKQDVYTIYEDCKKCPSKKECRQTKKQIVALIKESWQVE